MRSKLLLSATWNNAELLLIALLIKETETIEKTTQIYCVPNFLCRKDKGLDYTLFDELSADEKSFSITFACQGVNLIGY